MKACLLALVLSVSAALSARAVVTWNIVFENGADSGFFDGTLGDQRRQALSEVAAYVGSVLNYSGTIDLTVQESFSDSTSTVLASAGPYAALTGGYNNGLPYRHVTTGEDPFDRVPDAFVVVNFGHSYYLGTDPGGITTTQFDFRTVLLHELTHTLGVLTFIDADGGSRHDPSPGETAPETYSTFDSLLYKGFDDPVPLLTGSGASVTLNPALTADDLNGGDIWFRGPQAMAVYGGPVPVFSPPDYDSGSSLAHFSEAPADAVDSIMRPSLLPGEVRRTYSELDFAVMRDIGWNVVPEPGASALLLLAATFALRRRTA